MRAEEREVWTSYLRGWHGPLAVASPDLFVTQMKASQWGASWRHHDTECWMQTTSRGVELYRHDEEAGSRVPLLLVRWRSLTEWVDELPEQARDEARILRSRSTQHQSTAPSFTWDGHARDDLTIDQRRTACLVARAEWDREHFQPWATADRQLRASEAEFLGRWLTSPVVEQLDLFDEAIA